MASVHTSDGNVYWGKVTDCGDGTVSVTDRNGAIRFISKAQVKVIRAD